MRHKFGLAVYATIGACLVFAYLVGSHGNLSASSQNAPLQQTIPQSMRVEVTLQRPNSPAPSAPWRVPIRLGFYEPGNDTDPVRSFDNLWLDDSGVYVGSLNIPYGVYDVRVKNMHTLRNVKRNVTVGAATDIYMGTLLEGDADDDNRVRSSDFSLLRASYFTQEGDPGFDPRCDFDEDNRIRSSDFALLSANYFKSGDIEVTTALATGPVKPAPARPAAVSPARPGGTVALALEPATLRVEPGEMFTLTLTAHAGDQPFQTFDADIRFPPGFLQVVGPDGAPVTEITPLKPMDNVVINQVTNSTGRIVYGAGMPFLTEPAGGTVQLAEIRFKALQAATRVTVAIVDATVADKTGKWVTGPVSGTSVQIGARTWDLYLPLILP